MMVLLSVFHSEQKQAQNAQKGEGVEDLDSNHQHEGRGKRWICDVEVLLTSHVKVVGSRLLDEAANKMSCASIWQGFSRDEQMMSLTSPSAFQHLRTQIP